MTDLHVDAAFVTPEERGIYQDYERDRRLQLGRVFARFSLPIVALAVVVMGLTFVLRPATNTLSFKIVLISMLVASGLWYVVTLWLIRRRHATLAAAALLIASVISAVVYQATAVSQQGLTPEVTSVFGAYILIIALAGLLGNRWLLLLTMAATNGIAVLICYILPQPALGAPHTLTSTVFFSVLAQEWAITAVMIAAQDGLQRTLRALGDTRVAYERARQLDDLKDQFISHVNHELRNPVMAWLGQTQNLRRGAQRQVPYDHLQTFAARAETMGNAVRELINSMLETRQIEERPAITLEGVPLYDTLLKAAALLDPGRSAEERDLYLDIPANFVVWSEQVRLQQVLTNLLSNAVKYSPPGTPIFVTAATIRQTSARRRARGQVARPWAEIRVRDEGFGIPPAQIPILFQRFVRLPRDLASNIVGNGLGLYLCRVYIEAMGGRIRVESTGVAGEGSTFIMQLPLPPSTSGPLPATPERRTSVTLGASGKLMADALAGSDQ